MPRPWSYQEFLDSRPPLVRRQMAELGFAIEYFPHYMNRQLNLHSPGVVLLSFILRGHGCHHLGDERYPEHGGSLGITHYRQYHEIVTDDEGMEIMNLYLDLERHALPQLPAEMKQVLPQLIPLHPALGHRLNRMVRLVFTDYRATVNSLLYALHDELTAAPPGYAAAARCYLQLLLMTCCRQALAAGIVPLDDKMCHDDARMEAIRRHLDIQYAAPQSLAALAARACISPAALCRAFKAYTGMTVFAYLIRCRVQAAMMLLRSGDETITTIALCCGFNDQAHFNRKFKQLISVTPRDYREGVALHMDTASYSCAPRYRKPSSNRSS